MAHGLEIESSENPRYTLLNPAAFRDMLTNVEKTSLLATKIFQKTLQSYYAELDIRSMLLVDVTMEDLHMPAELRDFQEAQETYLLEITDMLKSDWVLKVYLLSYFLNFRFAVSNLMYCQ